MYVEFGVEFDVMECIGLDDRQLAELITRRMAAVSHNAKWRLVDTIKSHIYELETERLLPMGECESTN